ncbi:class I SAM-dependent methyltransferase [Phenylobacterium sp.]|uniref:class I SAM-dependent methyltransferase n=1 Tax=Phenylobacterium sp. TaxID=1871053 RepID=UPI0025FF9B1F|nr:methyltransferase domain-containing protein [Phenylobacterium sp.]
MLRLASACAVALTLAVSAPVQAKDAQLEAAVAGAQRAPENKARDAARHPVETLSFWGLKPKQTVIELSPGGGYWTEILAPYAKATGGAYVATASDLENPKLSEGARKGRAAFEAKYADPAKYGPIRYVNFGPVSGPLGAPGSADMVITARNIHNWMMNGSLDKVLKDAHAVLKPGGVLAVEEHRSDPKPELPGVSNGYVSTATVIAAAEKAGFKLAAKSEVNANPMDTKDHPFGVWTLPPSRWTTPNGQGSDPNFDRKKYDAIGESDRMTLRFVKAG